jgi:hypothetical protein
MNVELTEPCAAALVWLVDGDGDVTEEGAEEEARGVVAVMVCVEVVGIVVVDPLWAASLDCESVIEDDVVSLETTTVVEVTGDAESEVDAVVLGVEGSDWVEVAATVSDEEPEGASELLELADPPLIVNLGLTLPESPNTVIRIHDQRSRRLGRLTTHKQWYSRPCLERSALSTGRNQT